MPPVQRGRPPTALAEVAQGRLHCLPCHKTFAGPMIGRARRGGCRSQHRLELLSWESKRRAGVVVSWAARSAACVHGFATVRSNPTCPFLFGRSAQYQPDRWIARGPNLIASRMTLVARTISRAVAQRERNTKAQRARRGRSSVAALLYFVTFESSWFYLLAMGDKVLR